MISEFPTRSADHMSITWHSRGCSNLLAQCGCRSRLLRGEHVFFLTSDGWDKLPECSRVGLGKGKILAAHVKHQMS